MPTTATPRQIAMQMGHIYYSTGKPCKRGHESKRYVSSGTCYHCHQHHMDEWREKHAVSERGRLARLFKDDDMFVCSVNGIWKDTFRMLQAVSISSPTPAQQIIMDAVRVAYDALTPAQQHVQRIPMRPAASMNRDEFLRYLKFENGTVTNHHLFPQDRDAIGRLYIQVDASWFDAGEVMEVLRGDRNWAAVATIQRDLLPGQLPPLEEI